MRATSRCATAPQHHELTIRPSLKEVLPDLVYHLDEPSDPLSLCAWHVAKLARQHVKVVIGGDGGDELFGGYDRYYGNLYASYYSKLPADRAPPARWAPRSACCRRPAGTRASATSCAGCTGCLSSRAASAMRRACPISISTVSTAQSLFTEASHDELAAADAESALKAPFDALEGPT